MELSFHATTICAVSHNGKGAIAGDGQVTFGQNVVMKQTAKKVRRLYRGQVIAGFAGSVADAITLFEKFEAKLEEHQGNLQRAAVELAKDWRQDRVLRKLEALMIVMDKTGMLLISGGGEIIEPDDDVLAIGSGGTLPCQLQGRSNVMPQAWRRRISPAKLCRLLQKSACIRTVTLSLRSFEYR